MMLRKSLIPWGTVLVLTGFSLTPSIGLAGISALGAILLNLKRFGENKDVRFYLMMMTASFLPSILIPRQDILRLSCLLFLRSLTFYNVLLYIGENIDYSRFHRLLSGRLGERYSLSVSMALNILPYMRRNTLESHALFLLRQNRPGWFRGYGSFVKTILRQTIHTADQMAENLIADQRSVGPAVFIITGEVGSGKTTRARRMAEEFKSRGWSVQGLLAPGELERGRRTVIRVEDIRSGENRLLASRNGGVSDGCCDHGGFRFSKEGLDFSAQALRGYAPDDIVFLDEIGPLELTGGGHASALRRLLESPPAALFLVVRRSLVESVVKYFSIRNCTIIPDPETSKEPRPS